MRQDNKTYTIMNRETNNEFGTITDVLTTNKFYFGKPLQIKIATKNNSIKTTYNVLSLSLELQYIELYDENASPSNSQVYTIQEKQEKQ